MENESRLTLFNIALACGYPHPRFLGENLTSDEYYELLAYARLRLIGHDYFEHEFALTRFNLMRIQVDKKSQNKIKFENQLLRKFFRRKKPKQNAIEDEIQKLDQALLGMIK